MSSEEPIQLLEKIVLKDKEAFKGFYDHYAPLVYSLSMRLLGVRTDAEELTCDVFYQIWRHAENYKTEWSPPQHWMITFTQSRAMELASSKRLKNTAWPLDTALAQEKPEDLARHLTPFNQSPTIKVKLLQLVGYERVYEAKQQAKTRHPASFWWLAALGIAAGLLLIIIAGKLYFNS